MCKEEILRKAEYFGKYGSIVKLQVSCPTAPANGSGNNVSNVGNLAGSLVTFESEVDARRAFNALMVSLLIQTVLETSQSVSWHDEILQRVFTQSTVWKPRVFISSRYRRKRGFFHERGNASFVQREEEESNVQGRKRVFQER